MYRFAICLLVIASACDSVLGLEEHDRQDAAPTIDAAVDATDAPPADRDGDGLTDDVDLCIAPANEGATTDFDQDVLFDAVDACPFDNVNGVDGVDMDGIGLGCDPFLTVPDRSRCPMLFTSAALNSALWLGRSPDQGWSNESTRLIADPPATGNTLATTIVAQSLERAGITQYDAVFDVTGNNLAGSITLWLRADPAQPSTSDVGCRYINENGAGQLGVAHGSDLLAPDGTMTVPATEYRLRIVGRIVTTGPVGAQTRISCELISPGFSAESNASVPLPEGRMGFTVDRWLVAARGLHIIDQP